MNLYHTTDTCPYCGVRLYPPPKRNRKCPACHEEIYIRLDVETREKVMMRKHDALFYHGVETDRNRPVRGSVWDGFGICKACGRRGYYRWRMGIDHFPLVCQFCDVQAVERWEWPRYERDDEDEAD